MNVTTVLSASALTAAVTFTPAAANAVDKSEPDTRPCVSKDEFYGSKFMPKLDLEKRWEVVGQGRWNATFGMWAYPRCGFDKGGAYFAVGWDWERGLMYRVSYRTPGAMPNGQPM